MVFYCINQSILRLEIPKYVVFDEMHYGKYAAHYLRNTFFFDSNPPLGKEPIKCFPPIPGKFCKGGGGNSRNF